MALLLILFQIGERRFPRHELVFEFCNVHSEPCERLHLLEIKDAPLLFQFLERARMMRAHEFRQFRLIRRRLLQQTIATNHGKSRSEMRDFLIFPTVASIGSGERFEIAESRSTPVARSLTEY